MSNSLAAPWTIAHQAPLSVGFSRREYWSGSWNFNCLCKIISRFSHTRVRASAYEFGGHEAETVLSTANTQVHTSTALRERGEKMSTVGQMRRLRSGNINPCGARTGVPKASQSFRTVCGRAPCGSAGKEPTCNTGDLGSIPGLGRTPEKGAAAHSSVLAWRMPWTA